MGEDRKLEIVKALCQGLNDEQLSEAQTNLDLYLEHAFRVYERIRNDPAAYGRFRALTASIEDPTIQRKGSHPLPSAST